MNTQILKPLHFSLAVLVLFQGLSFAHADITDLPDLSPEGKTYNYEPPKVEVKKPEVEKPKDVVKTVPKTPPKTQPKISPKASPKVSPKTTPKTAPKAPTQPRPKPEPKATPAPVKVTPSVIPVIGKHVGYMNYGRPELGTIKEIYENGMVLLTTYPNGTTVVEIKDLYNFTRCSPTGTLCKDSRVLLNNYTFQPGKIYGYFGDLYTIVVTDESPNDIYYAKQEDVSAAQNCSSLRKICVGESVVYVGPYSVYFGKAETILPNGEITIRYENRGSDNFEEELIYKTTVSNCAERICVKDRVLFKDSYGYYPATVLKIYAGTIFVVQKDGDDGHVFTKANQLSKTK